MAVLDIRQRTGWFFVAVTVGHVILISAQVNTRGGIPVLEAVTFGVFAEIQRAATSAVGGVQEGWENYFALQEIRRENEQLQQEVAQLRIGLQQEQALAQEARALQELLKLQRHLPLATTAGNVTGSTVFPTDATLARSNVIGSGASPYFWTVTIDKGTHDGLKPDMAVIAPRGVVGRIITPSARASKVQLLIDSDAAAAATVERSRAQGLVVGTGGAAGGAICLRMDYVPGTADIKVGDRVVTSGLDGIYPKGFAIGQIESIDGNCNGRGIVVRPAVEFSALEAVLVVLTPPAPVEAGEPESNAP